MGRGNLILGLRPDTKQDQSSGEEPVSLVSWGLPLTSTIQVYGFRTQKPREQGQMEAEGEGEVESSGGERDFMLTCLLVTCPLACPAVGWEGDVSGRSPLSQ